MMPHLHLSLQAGDDVILKRMKRRHLRADAIAFCDQVRRLRPDVVSESDNHEKYQANAPAVQAGLYVVPRVIE